MIPSTPNYHVCGMPEIISISLDILFRIVLHTLAEIFFQRLRFLVRDS